VRQEQKKSKASLETGDIFHKDVLGMELGGYQIGENTLDKMKKRSCTRILRFLLVGI